MRRLEMLSNTIFGVAMTLLAYDLPKASSFTQAPAWIDVARIYGQPVIALTISFIVSGLFWFSHHRRLAVAPEASRGVVFLNLFFCSRSSSCRSRTAFTATSGSIAWSR